MLFLDSSTILHLCTDGASERMSKLSQIVMNEIQRDYTAHLPVCELLPTGEHQHLHNRKCMR